MDCNGMDIDVTKRDQADYDAVSGERLTGSDGSAASGSTQAPMETSPQEPEQILEVNAEIARAARRIQQLQESIVDKPSFTVSRNHVDALLSFGRTSDCIKLAQKKLLATMIPGQINISISHHSKTFGIAEWMKSTTVNMIWRDCVPHWLADFQMIGWSVTGYYESDEYPGEKIPRVLSPRFYNLGFNLGSKGQKLWYIEPIGKFLDARVKAIEADMVLLGESAPSGVDARKLASSWFRVTYLDCPMVHASRQAVTTIVTKKFGARGVDMSKLASLPRFTRVPSEISGTKAAMSTAEHRLKKKMSSRASQLSGSSYGGSDSAGNGQPTAAMDTTDSMPRADLDGGVSSVMQSYGSTHGAAPTLGQGKKSSGKHSAPIGADESEAGSSNGGDSGTLSGIGGKDAQAMPLTSRLPDSVLSGFSRTSDDLSRARELIATYHPSTSVPPARSSTLLGSRSQEKSAAVNAYSGKSRGVVGSASDTGVSGTSGGGPSGRKKASSKSGISDGTRDALSKPQAAGITPQQPHLTTTIAPDGLDSTSIASAAAASIINPQLPPPIVSGNTGIYGDAPSGDQEPVKRSSPTSFGKIQGEMIDGNATSGEGTGKSSEIDAIPIDEKHVKAGGKVQTTDKSDDIKQQQQQQQKVTEIQKVDTPSSRPPFEISVLDAEEAWPLNCDGFDIMFEDEPDDVVASMDGTVLTRSRAFAVIRQLLGVDELDSDYMSLVTDLVNHPIFFERAPPKAVDTTTAAVARQYEEGNAPARGQAATMSYVSSARRAEEQVAAEAAAAAAAQSGPMQITSRKLTTVGGFDLPKLTPQSLTDATGFTEWLRAGSFESNLQNTLFRSRMNTVHRLNETTGRICELSPMSPAGRLASDLPDGVVVSQYMPPNPPVDIAEQIRLRITRALTVLGIPAGIMTGDRNARMASDKTNLEHLRSTAHGYTTAFVPMFRRVYLRTMGHEHLFEEWNYVASGKCTKNRQETPFDGDDDGGDDDNGQDSIDVSDITSVAKAVSDALGMMRIEITFSPEEMTYENAKELRADGVLTNKATTEAAVREFALTGDSIRPEAVLSDAEEMAFANSFGLSMPQVPVPRLSDSDHIPTMRGSDGGVFSQRGIDRKKAMLQTRFGDKGIGKGTGRDSGLGSGAGVGDMSSASRDGIDHSTMDMLQQQQMFPQYFGMPNMCGSPMLPAYPWGFNGMGSGFLPGSIVATAGGFGNWGPTVQQQLLQRQGMQIPPWLMPRMSGDRSRVRQRESEDDRGDDRRYDREDDREDGREESDDEEHPRQQRKRFRGDSEISRQQDYMRARDKAGRMVSVDQQQRDGTAQNTAPSAYD